MLSSDDDSTKMENKQMISFDKTIHNFGTVVQGDVLKAVFNYTGDTPITEGNIILHCGCTTKSYDPQTKILTLGLSSDVVGFKQSTAQLGDVTLILQANILPKQ